MTSPSFPRFRAVAEHAVLVEFGESIDPAVHERVRHLDSALAERPPHGFVEAVPAYTNVLVAFDPIVTDHAALEAALATLIEEGRTAAAASAEREVLVCYEDELAPDLDEVARRVGLTREAAIAAHLAGDYRVFLYGFAPGYAYLAGTPEPIQLPRKASPVRGIPAGAVLIAGPQCLVTTLAMPTGWWIVGRSPTRILRDEEARPFLFDIGDKVRFRRVDRAAFDAETRRG